MIDGIWDHADIIEGGSGRFDWFDLIDVNAMLDWKNENEYRANEAHARRVKQDSHSRR